VGEGTRESKLPRYQIKQRLWTNADSDSKPRESELRPRKE